MSFFKRIEQTPQQRAVALMLPLTAHEVEILVQALSAVRSGNRASVEYSLRELAYWFPTRVLGALGTASERYLKLLGQLGVLNLDGDGENTRSIIARLCAALPASIRPSEDAMFDALVVCTSLQNENVQQRIAADFNGAVIGQLYLTAALCSVAAEAPQGTIPNVPQMLHAILAPWDS